MPKRGIALEPPPHTKLRLKVRLVHPLTLWKAKHFRKSSVQTCLQSTWLVCLFSSMTLRAGCTKDTTK